MDSAVSRIEGVETVETDPVVMRELKDQRRQLEDAIYNSFVKRLRLCIAAEGGHFEV